MKPFDKKELEENAKRLRKATLDLTVEYRDTHIASAFSIIELLTVLYDRHLTEQDRFILSKGHGCFSLYAKLREKGYSPIISGHPDIDRKNGICVTTGSLGHGLPNGFGMALAKKMKKEPGNVYVLMGDGECQEGTVWESLNLAAHYQLKNLVGIVDHNKLQAMDRLENVLSLGNLAAKFQVFNWNVREVDGHDVSDIDKALIQRDYNFSLPYMIIAHTIKGKGLSFMENDPKWQSRFPNQEELKQAYKELK